jgi:hypothetical protein
LIRNSLRAKFAWHARLKTRRVLQAAFVCRSVDCIIL